MFQYYLPSWQMMSKRCLILAPVCRISRCLWQRHLEQVKSLAEARCLAEALGARNASRSLWQRHLEQETLQKMSLVEALGTRNAETLGARNAARCLRPRLGFELFARTRAAAKKVAKLPDLFRADGCQRLSAASGSAEKNNGTGLRI